MNDQAGDGHPLALALGLGLGLASISLVCRSGTAQLQALETGSNFGSIRDCRSTTCPLVHFGSNILLWKRNIQNIFFERKQMEA